MLLQESVEEQSNFWASLIASIQRSPANYLCSPDLKLEDLKSAYGDIQQQG